MGQRYIGSKTKIKDVIVSEIQKFVPKIGTVVDIMCGFGSISGELRKKNYEEEFSYLLKGHENYFDVRKSFFACFTSSGKDFSNEFTVMCPLSYRN